MVSPSPTYCTVKQAHDFATIAAQVFPKISYLLVFSKFKIEFIVWCPRYYLNVVVIVALLTLMPVICSDVAGFDEFGGYG